MKTILISILKLGLRVLYAPMKLLKTKNQVVYLSRQRNEKDIDITLLEKAIKDEDDSITQVFRLKMIGDGLIEKIKYCFYVIGDMYYLATSKVAVVDTYSITVSCLKHKEELKVIQMWHALGAIKKFGYQAFGTKEGRDEKVSLAMCMHKNYDYVLAPSSETARFYMEGFNVTSDKIKICPMPRVDFITDEKTRSDEFFSQNPNLLGKNLVLYVPTFRDRDSYIAEQLKTELADKDNYQLIIKAHPLSKMKVDGDYAIKGDFSTFDLMKIADIIITDYSACAFEASLLTKPLYFYVPDFDEYLKDRGINVDIRKEMKSSVFYEASKLVNSIVDVEYNYNELFDFRKKFIEPTQNPASVILAKFIVRLIGE